MIKPDSFQVFYTDDLQKTCEFLFSDPNGFLFVAYQMN